MSLTSACCVHSNVYGLCNIHWVRYHTAVDPLHSTSSAVQNYSHLTSVFVEIPLLLFIWNSSIIGIEPDPQGRPSASIRPSATSSEVSHTEQGTTSFSNVLQGQTTVVLVCCIIEWEPDITCTWEESDGNVLFCTYLKLNVIEQTATTRLWVISLKSKAFLQSCVYSHLQSFHSLSVCHLVNDKTEI